MHSYLSVGLRTEDGQARLAVSGELDMASCRQLEQAIELARGPGAKLTILDLDGLDFIDLSGLRVLLAAHEQAERDGRRLVLVNTSDQVVRLLRMTRASEVLHVVEREPPAGSNLA